MKLNRMIALSLLLVMCAASVAVAAETYVKKVDNFIFLVDTSGSMNDKFMDTKKTKNALVADIMGRINKAIPELGYQGALATVAYPAMLQKMEVYKSAAYGKSLTLLPVDTGVRSTPLGDGIAALEPTVKGLSGRTGIILLSDGQENDGAAKAVAAASDLAKKYGVCFHVISFADPVNGDQELLNKIASNKSCSVTATATQLADQKALEKFVKDIFYDGAAKTDPCAADDDADGVNNCKDKCPNTPKDLAVDADGCPKPIVKKLKVNFDFDKSDIKPQYFKELDDFCAFMKQYPNTPFEIDGHTDSKGTDEYNKKLSQRRADSIRKYLIEKCKMNAKLISTMGFGESKPIADNNTDAGRAENRRIEAVLKGVFQKK